LPSTEDYYLDIPGTVKAIAETDIWVPKLEPLLEPWLELALVVDATASMVIWQRTILGLRRVLAQSGIFRDVRLWSLEAQPVTPETPSPDLEQDPQTSESIPPPEPLLFLRAGYGPFTDQQPPCPPKELFDPRGRRLIVVVSDCLAPRWETQQIRDILKTWGQRGPLALLQVLPEWLWNRTGLLEVDRGQVVNPDVGKPTQALTFLRRGRRQRPPSAGIKVPVFTLELDVVARWSHMVAGRRAIAAPGLLFTAAQVRELIPAKDLSPDQATPTANLTEPILTPAERLADFQRFSSPVARQLAGYLAACPEVNLPIIRMVQAALLPESQQVHVAEVLLGGLFRPQIALTAETLADQVQYVFYEGVQPLVQDTVRPDFVFQTLSLWLKNRFGYSLEDVRAYVTPERLEQVKPFAGVMLDVLKRQESQYSDLIRAVEQTYQPFTSWVKGPGAVVQDDGLEPQFLPLEPFEFIEAQFIEAEFIEAELDEAPSDREVFPPPLQTETFTIITFEVQPEPLTPELESFSFIVATVRRPQGQQQQGQRQAPAWEILREPGEAQRFLEPLPGIPPLEMVAIPGGTFLMGSADDEPERSNHEGPQQEVTIAPFFMGAYPVTQRQWRAVAKLPQVERELESNPSWFKGLNRPVEKVSWNDAVEFCARLSALTGRPYRLPSEAEWEYACRAGTTTSFHFGETLTAELANYRARSTYNGGPEGEDQGQTTPVDQFGVANPLGLRDMHGNVWEWCQDAWHANYEGAPRDGSAWLEGGESYRVLRGGSWDEGLGGCRSACRDLDGPANRNDDRGFRVCCGGLGGLAPAPSTPQSPSG
jgi:formylglycine-generating enzyme required for sulfatase activity